MSTEVVPHANGASAPLPLATLDIPASGVGPVTVALSEAVVRELAGGEQQGVAPPRVAKKLAGKLAEVMACVEWVKKRGENKFHGYAYATEADILDAVRSALAERSVVITPILKGVKREAHRTSKDTATSLWTVDLDMEIEDGETGEIKIRPWVGIGEDPGDKGIYKAITGGVKYFILKQFLISTGDDPEASEGGESTHPQARQNAQAARNNGRQADRAQNGRQTAAMADRLREQRSASSAPATSAAPSAPASSPVDGPIYRVVAVNRISGEQNAPDAVYGVSVVRADSGEQVEFVTRDRGMAKACLQHKKDQRELRISVEASDIGKLIVEVEPVATGSKGGAQ